MLKLEHGVDLDKIAWVASDEEHVAEYSSNDPPNVTRQLGANLNQMLAGGELAAGLWAQAAGEAIKPFYPDPDAATAAFYQRFGVFPIDHVIVIKDSVLAEYPWLAQALYEALKAAKDDALRKEPHAHVGGAGIMEGDPLPYGLEANRPALQMLLDMCIDQQVLHKPTTLEELFPIGKD
jgi:4,5-dihydroxyphthalate decarboxylase